MFDWLKMPKYPAPTPREPFLAPYNDSLSKEPVTFYAVGPTDNNRISLKIGNSGINMTKSGAESLIALLQVAAAQLTDEEDEDEQL